ncbi:hypothetical protein HYFRA_00012121 [Hymenoscyphus fraxineus]|uniref:Uncharacterized protein n=1 Tax=Hymenoscyphus fraxineus TaxID=746836 RepID=A0A9N9L764_9HELO|nr:hypothetical protein HYFRA_00012121 [Hymenoscyphus fraxineus]
MPSFFFVVGAALACLALLSVVGYYRVLRLPVRHPRATHNLALSPTLRVLIIALRRGTLRDFTTLEELLDPKGPRKIIFKPEFAKTPVFIAGKHAGRGLDPSGKALSSHGLHKFFKRRAIAAGYPENVRFYSFRKGMMESADRVVSRENIRAAVGHAPGSTTMEESYLNHTLNIDLVAIALGEEQEDVGLNKAALNRVEYRIPQQEVKKFLDAVVAQDPDYQKANTKRDKANVARRARARGQRSLRDQQREEADRMSEEDFRKRVEDLQKPGQLWNEIMARVEKIRSAESAQGLLVSLDDEDIEEDYDHPLMDLGYLTHIRSAPLLFPSNISLLLPPPSLKSACRFLISSTAAC